MEKTIYIITTSEKILLRAFTSKQEALEALETQYKTVEIECYLEPCCLVVDSQFIEQIKKN